MAIGGRSREEGILGEWLLPVKGVVRGLNDLTIPKDSLLDGLNIEILDGTLRGRRGLTALSSQLFAARPMAALNVWQNTTAAFIVLATTEKVWTYDVSAATWTDRSGSLTADADDATRITQFAFGSPTVTRSYICNGKDALKTWKPGDATATTITILGAEKVTNGSFISSSGWTMGTGWSFDATNEEMDHAAGNTANLEQSVNAKTAIEYRVTFTVRNMTAGGLTPEIGGVIGSQVTVDGTYSQDITTTGTGNLKFTPTSIFDGSVDDVSVQEVSGDAPIFRDLTVYGDRLVGLVGAHDIRWFEPLSETRAPETNKRILADTPPPTVAIRKLGNLGVAVYKQDGVWLGEITGLPGSSAIRLSHLLAIEGPAGPTALVEAGDGGPHVYMTDTGRVCMFTGSSIKWIGDGVWKITKDEIDQTKPNRIWGVYKPAERQVWFTYKRTGQSATDGLVIVQLQRKDVDLPFACYPGRWYKEVTAGCTLNDKTIGADLVFTANSGAEKAYKMTGADDAGAAVTSYIQTGYVPVPMLESTRILSMEPLVERLAGYGSLTVKAITNNVLDTTLGTQSSGATVDLTSTPIKEVVGVDARGRFLGARLEWTSTATVRYRGITLRTSPEFTQQAQRGQ